MTTTSVDTTANIATIAAIYDAFGRGDVPAILDVLADDVTWDGDWADSWGQRTPMAHYLPRRGPAQVGEFFALLADYTLYDFQVLDFLASERQVVAQVIIELGTPSGGRYRDEELHLWTLRPDGKVSALRHYIDTAKHLAADSGVDTRL